MSGSEGYSKEEMQKYINRNLKSTKKSTIKKERKLKMSESIEKEILGLSDDAKISHDILIARYNCAKTKIERDVINGLRKKLFGEEIKKKKKKKAKESLVGYRTMFDVLVSRGLDLSTLKLDNESHKKKKFVKYKRISPLTTDKVCPRFPTKKTYASLKQAKRALRCMGHRFGTSMGYYECPTCKMYHLTTNR